MKYQTTAQLKGYGGNWSVEILTLKDSFKYLRSKRNSIFQYYTIPQQGGVDCHPDEGGEGA